MFTREWDLSFPSDNRKMNNFADDIRNTRVDFGERYIDDGVYSSYLEDVGVVPSGFGLIAGIKGEYTEGNEDSRAIKYINAAATEHLLSAKSCPLFFDASGSVIIGNEVGGTAFYAKQVALPFLIGSDTEIVSHGIVGSISTNQKIYGIIVVGHDGYTWIDWTDDSEPQGYEHCFVGDTDIEVKRGDDSTVITFYVTVIYKA